MHVFGLWKEALVSKKKKKEKRPHREGPAGNPEPSCCEAKERTTTPLCRLPFSSVLFIQCQSTLKRKQFLQKRNQQFCLCEHLAAVLNIKILSATDPLLTNPHLCDSTIDKSPSRLCIILPFLKISLWIIRRKPIISHIWETQKKTSVFWQLHRPSYIFALTDYRSRWHRVRRLTVPPPFSGWIQ